MCFQVDLFADHRYVQVGLCLMRSKTDCVHATHMKECLANYKVNQDQLVTCKKIWTQELSLMKQKEEQNIEEFDHY